MMARTAQPRPSSDPDSSAATPSNDSHWTEEAPPPWLWILILGELAAADLRLIPSLIPGRDKGAAGAPMEAEDQLSN